jgi:GGDEF domain-containing protein
MPIFAGLIAFLWVLQGALSLILAALAPEGTPTSRILVVSFVIPVLFGVALFLLSKTYQNLFKKKPTALKLVEFSESLKSDNSEVILHSLSELFPFSNGLIRMGSAGTKIWGNSKIEAEVEAYEKARLEGKTNFSLKSWIFETSLANTEYQVFISWEWLPLLLPDRVRMISKTILDEAKTHLESVVELERLKKLGIHSPEEPYYSKQFLLEVLQKEISAAQRRNESVSLLLAHLDGLDEIQPNEKDLRESYSKHLFGLMEIFFRGEDVLSKIDFNKIGIALRSANPEDVAQRTILLQENVRASPFSWNGKTYSMEVTMLVSAYPHNATTAKGLLNLSLIGLDKHLKEDKSSRNAQMLKT